MSVDERSVSPIECGYNAGVEGPLDPQEFKEEEYVKDTGNYSEYFIYTQKS